MSCTKRRLTNGDITAYAVKFEATSIQDTLDHLVRARNSDTFLKLNDSGLEIWQGNSRQARLGQWVLQDSAGKVYGIEDAQIGTVWKDAPMPPNEMLDCISNAFEERDTTGTGYYHLYEVLWVAWINGVRELLQRTGYNDVAKAVDAELDFVAKQKDREKKA